MAVSQSFAAREAPSEIRELAFQRLVQRLLDLEGFSDVMGTVPYYAIIDTGLVYSGINPATGWTGESCVLLVRRRQSRLFDSYQGMNFSGVCPDDVHSQGLGRELRRVLHGWGVSAEFEPRAVFHGTDSSEDEALLRDQSGTWNLQADAACTHFMDFSDFYVLPQALQCPALAERLWGHRDRESAAAACLELRRNLSKEQELCFGSTKQNARKRYVLLHLVLNLAPGDTPLMAWASFLLLQLLRVEAQSLLQVEGQLRRTQQAAASPHDAAWFYALEAMQPSEALESEHPHPRLRPQRQQATLSVAQGKVSENLEVQKHVTQKPSISHTSTNLEAEQTEGPLHKRAVLGNLTCSKPGCAANVTLQLYDPETEYARDCNLTLAVHATDFDDNFAGERVANFLANGRAMGGDCYPLVNGCVSKASRALLFTCISDLPVDTVISSQGKLRVDAEIPGNVDECPYHGNLLHGVTTIQCHVGKLVDLTTTSTTTTTTTVASENSVAGASGRQASPEDLDFVKKWLAEHPGKSFEDMPGYSSFYNLSNMSAQAATARPASLGISGYYGSSARHLEAQLGSGPGPRGQARPRFPFHRPTNLATQGALRCAEKGCSTSLILSFNRTLAQINRCVAQLWVNQTDFDNLDGAQELLSVSVAGKEVLSQAKLGKNPCRSAYSGKPLSLKDIRYHALEDLDITQAIRDGPVKISAQISDQVDECPSNGYLLDSALEVSCNISTIGALLEEDEVSVADVLDLNKA
eukprot:s9657_g1.t1